MVKWFRQLDSILRGDATRLPSLSEGRIEIPAGGLSTVIVLLAVFYGLCMGSFNLLQGLEDRAHDTCMQIVASAVKLPLLFFLTLAVTLPSLYVFNALVGSRLSILSVLRLLVAAIGVILAVLASLGPIVVFFALSTPNYPFMILLNVAMCTVSGVLGLAFLLRTMHRLVLVQEALDGPEPAAPPAEAAPPQAPSGPSGALDQVGAFTSRKALRVFRIWTLVFALVGAQMSWVLRPFVGNPNMPFTWFRARESNFFLAVLRSLGQMFGL